MRKLRLGCGEWGFRQLPREEHFRIAKRFGFKTLEFGIGGGQIGRLPEQVSDADVKQFLQMRNDYGFTLPFCCIENDFTLPDADDHATMLEKSLSQINAAHRLGATHVRLFAGFTPADQMTEAIWERLIDAFTRADALCRRLGMKIAIETHGKITMRNGAAFHEQTISTHPDSLRRLLKQLPPGVGFNFDPGNLKAAAPEDRNFRLDLIDSRINYCHIKDWRRKAGGWEAVAAGDDDLDYGSLISAMSYEGICLIEYEPTEDVEAGIARSLKYLNRVTPVPVEIV